MLSRVLPYLLAPIFYLLSSFESLPVHIRDNLDVFPPANLLARYLHRYQPRVRKKHSLADGRTQAVV